jgi:hypothetical protein
VLSQEGVPAPVTQLGGPLGAVLIRPGVS